MIPDVSIELQSHSLLEESREPWQYAVTDEFVYVSETTDRLGDAGNIPSKIYLEGHTWMEIQFTLEGDGSAYYVLFVRRLRKNEREVLPREIGEIDHRLTSVRRNPPVLIEVTQLVKPPQRMRFIGFPSMIWLKRINHTDSFLGNTDNTSFERVPLGFEQDWTINNGKRNPLGNPAEACQGPHQLVQAGAHIVDGVSGNQANGKRNIQQLEAQYMPAIFKVILSAKGIGVRVYEFCDFRIKELKVALRPSKFRFGVCYSAHKPKVTLGELG
jgi:hypothetical protein